MRTRIIPVEGEDLLHAVPELVFALKFYRGELVFRPWLDRCEGTSFNHGSVLEHALGSPIGDKAGMPDCVYGAEKLLRAAMGAGWIVQCPKPSPTPQQQFFGARGMDWTHMKKVKNEDMCATFFGYEPNRSNVTMMQWLRLKRT